ncbi:hypothetical protein VR7878_01651 [Vibrio ruber DSM 16370]|uniref:Uncharacterized protein n=1 Tax=Vibrio ruber (strain DSM 16370 / JCM 11486 / BCRC 17186 / CECT 7878 / LMG 23124 / VR1) TaxID=1123498 RepID=A0A1R4LI63_VIBR1|nr:hypothetical protein [Vibrio ruber]SJN56205.1 hypothetical protein VR7878_01651 [Vibrio ruber DSM 16370]
MNKINVFHVTKDISTNSEVSKVTLSHRELNQEVELSGKILEAQYKTDAGYYLLFLTEDVPYEEALHIYLLDQSLKIIESLELSAEYTAGILRDIQVIEKNKIRFFFFDNDQSWQLEVLQAPKRRNPLRSAYPVKKKDKFWEKSRLRLQPL